MIKINLGFSGEIPITGDCNGDGYDTIGIFRPSTAQFFLDYDNDGVADMDTTFWVIGDISIIGDWDGDGDDNIRVYRSGNYLFIGQGQDFVVLDITDPAALLEVGRVNTDGFIRDIAVSGDYTYIIDGNNGLIILDISNPESPVLTGQYNTAGHAHRVL